MFLIDNCDNFVCGLDVDEHLKQGLHINRWVRVLVLQTSRMGAVRVGGGWGEGDDPCPCPCPCRFETQYYIRMWIGICLMFSMFGLCIRHLYKQFADRRRCMFFMLLWREWLECPKCERTKKRSTCFSIFLFEVVLFQFYAYSKI